MPPQPFGQHFLRDSSIAQREVSYASITKDDVVLEIGPGRGMITRFLAQQARHVIAIEIDKRLIERLIPTLPANVTLIEADVLSVDFTTLPPFNKIVSNLPFEISSPVTFKFLEYPFSLAVLMYQKDFAARLVAQAGGPDYSRLSVHIYYKACCAVLEDIPKESFSPIPKVDASIVQLVPRKKAAFFVRDEAFFLLLTKQLFMHRRKKIRSTIKAVYQRTEHLPFLDSRVEDLTPEQIGQLSDALLDQVSSSSTS